MSMGTSFSAAFVLFCLTAFLSKASISWNKTWHDHIKLLILEVLH